MEIPFTGWFLENRTGNHSKFYTVLVADNGLCLLNWGRIGTDGQFKLQKFATLEDAKALGLRQVYSKQSAGYTMLTDGFRFTIDEAEVDSACRYTKFSSLAHAFAKAQLDPQYEVERKSVLGHYDEFVLKAQALLSGAAERSFAEVWVEFEELEKSWQSIKDKHDEAATTIEFARQVLSQRLMSGAL
jgi:predicted DNA-binding WGR domain protein